MIKKALKNRAEKLLDKICDEWENKWKVSDQFCLANDFVSVIAWGAYCGKSKHNAIEVSIVWLALHKHNGIMFNESLLGNLNSVKPQPPTDNWSVRIRDFERFKGEKLELLNVMDILEKKEIRTVSGVDYTRINIVYSSFKKEIKNRDQATKRNFISFLSSGVSSAFQNYLDIEGRGIPNTIQPYHIYDIAWLSGAGSDYTVGDWQKTCLRRCEFLQTHPVTGTVYYMEKKQNPAPSWAEIDNAEPSIPLLAKHFDYKPGFIRAFSRFNNTLLKNTCLSMMGSSSFQNINHSIPDQWIHDMLEWNEHTWFFFYSTILNIQHQTNREIIKENFLPNTKPGLGGCNFATMARENPMPHFRDVCLSMVRELFFPAQVIASNTQTLENSLIRTAYDAILSLGLNRLASVCLNHLEDIARNTGSECYSGKTSWPETAPETIAPNNMVIRCITNQTELNEESKQLNHCVKTYGESCSNRTTSIFSIGKWDAEYWRSSSTFQVKMKSHDHTPVVVQHYAAKNSKPALGCLQALDWWIECIKQKKIDFRSDMLIVENLGVVNFTVQNLNGLLTPNWQSREECDRRWNKWRRILNTNHQTCSGWLKSLSKEFNEVPQNKAVLTAVEYMEELNGLEKELEGLENNFKP